MRIGLLVIAIALLSACSDEPRRAATPEEIEVIRKAMRADLRDPIGAQFEDVVIDTKESGVEHIKTVCGRVNATNGFGGYEGFRVFDGILVTDPATGVETGTIGIDASVAVSGEKNEC